MRIERSVRFLARWIGFPFTLIAGWGSQAPQSLLSGNRRLGGPRNRLPPYDFVSLHRHLFPLNPDGLQFPGSELTLEILKGRVRNQNLSARGVGAEPRCKVHRVSDARIIHPLGGAYVARRDRAGVDSNAHLHRLLASFLPAVVKPPESALHLDGGFHGSRRL